MARNRAEPTKVAPEPESSEEEEEEEEEEASEEGSEESGSETEAEETLTQAPAKPKQTPPPASKEASSSSGEEESGSETESDPDDAPTSKAKPLAAKPVVEKQKANDGARSKPIAPDPVTPTKSAAAKRSAGDASPKDAKKPKKADEPETSEKKSNLFQRLWSEEDEINVLEGMIEYTSKKKADPVADLSAFHDFIKEKLSIDATRTQLQDKIRRLKKKYENNKSKEKEGEEKTFSKPHELKSYDLSKRIWGNQNIKENGVAKVGSPKANGRVAKKTDTKKVNGAEKEEANDVKNAMVVSEEKLPAAKSYSVGATVEERMLIAGQELVGEEEWEKLKEQEFEAYLKQLQVKAAQTKLVLDAMKARGH